MSFMQPVVVFGTWLEVETDWGLEYVREEAVGYIGLELGEQMDADCPEWKRARRALRPYVMGRPEAVTLIKGHGVRLSAPGYLDCTEWMVFESEAEALAYLAEELLGDLDYGGGT